MGIGQRIRLPRYHTYFLNFDDCFRFVIKSTAQYFVFVAMLLLIDDRLVSFFCTFLIRKRIRK